MGIPRPEVRGQWHSWMSNILVHLSSASALSGHCTASRREISSLVYWRTGGTVLHQETVPSDCSVVVRPRRRYYATGGTSTYTKDPQVKTDIRGNFDDEPHSGTQCSGLIKYGEQWAEHERIAAHFRDNACAAF